jgi:hypothetical protein
VTAHELERRRPKRQRIFTVDRNASESGEDRGWRKLVLDRIVEAIETITTAVPALFVDATSPNFIIIRAMFSLLLVVLVLAILAVLPSAMARCARTITSLIERKF